MESMPISYRPPNSFRGRLGIHHRLSYDQYSIPSTFQVHVDCLWRVDFWIYGTFIPRFQLYGILIYRIFAYLEHFSRDKRVPSIRNRVYLT